MDVRRMNNINNSLDSANKININLTEKKIVEITLDAISTAYKPLDSFSMWLLGATGAFVALIISNTHLFCTLSSSKYGLYVEVIALLLSVFCGLCAKFFFSLRIEICRNSIESLNKKIIPILDQYFQNADQIESMSKTISTDINFYRISKKIASTFPNCLKKRILKSFIYEIRKARPNYALCIPYLIWQYVLILIQAIAFIFAVLVLILCIFP